MTPAEVNVDNEHMVRKRLYPIKSKSYKVGDRVRIAMQKQSFRKVIWAIGRTKSSRLSLVYPPFPSRTNS